MDFLTPQDVSTLLARLNGLITDAQALQIDIQQKTIERRASDRSIAQALGANRVTNFFSAPPAERRQRDRRKTHPS